MPDLLCIAFCIVQFTNLTSLKRLITFYGRLQWGHLHGSNKQLVKIISTCPPPPRAPQNAIICHIASLKCSELVRTLMCKCVTIGTAASIMPQWHHSAKARTKNEQQQKLKIIKPNQTNKKNTHPKRQQRESHMRSLAQDCRSRAATVAQEIDGADLHFGYVTSGLRVQMDRVWLLA